MIAPNPTRCLRDIDRKHVDFLKEAFIQRPENNTIFFGNVLGDVDMNILDKSGNMVVETVGGNHSRIALQELLEEGIQMSPTVHMTLYTNLTDTEALKLGFDHNVGHEFGKPTSPEELMLLFRRELQKRIGEEELRNPPFPKIKEWKQTCSEILGISKSKLHNVYHCMLAIAVGSSEFWGVFKSFISLWNEEKIKRKPKGALKKTHFSKMSAVSKEKRIPLLIELNNGNIDWVQFSDKCHQLTKKNPEIQDRDMLDNEENQSSGPTLSHPAHGNERELQAMKDSNLALKDSNLSLKSQIKELEDVVEKQIVDTVALQICRRKLSNCEEKNKDLVRENKLHLDRIRHLENQLLELKDVNMELKAENQSLRKEIEDRLKERSQKRKLNLHVINPEEEVLAATDKKKSKTQLPQVMDKELSTEINMAVVEYNAAKIYLGELSEGNNFTFAKSPLGKLDIPINWSQTKDSSFVLNPTDRMKINPIFIVCKVNCKKVKNNLILGDRHKADITEGITSYNNKM